MEKLTVNIATITPIASRREKAYPLLEKLRELKDHYDIIELDFRKLDRVDNPFLDQIAAAAAEEGWLSKLIFLIRLSWSLRHLRFISRYRRLIIKYRMEEDSETQEINEPPPPPQPEPMQADMEELPPSPYDPNPKRFL